MQKYFDTFIFENFTPEKLDEMNKAKRLILTALLIISIFASSCAGDVAGNPATSETETQAEANEPQRKGRKSPENANVPEDGVYIVYAVNPSAAGTIKGEYAGYFRRENQKVLAEPNLGYKFVKWSDGRQASLSAIPRIPARLSPRYSIMTFSSCRSFL